ncbi:MAG: hypothetical protein JKY95_18085 [Planctomycetaceae bacterium]|nr:hypothetical protein [Planctomycetaceae bacterium]
MGHHQKSWFGSAFSFLFRRKLPMETETSLFILVSVLDVLMTWFLISRGGFVESNPVAAFFLNHWGRKGFVAFKFICVLVVCVTTQVIYTKYPRLASMILGAGVLVVGTVVVYSLTLYLKHGGSLPFSAF